MGVVLFIYFYGAIYLFALLCLSFFLLLGNI